MSKAWQIAGASMAGLGAMALMVLATLSAAQEAGRPMNLAPKPHAATQPAAKTAAKPPVKHATAAQPQKQTALALAAPPPEKKKEHRLILQVNSNDPAAMNLTLNNAMNVTQYYKDAGESVKIEVVTFGPGLHMLRDDTSPVKMRIETMALIMPEISYKACGNTQENMHKAENKDIPIIPQAEVVKSGVIHIMQLEEQGWTYVKP